MLSPMFGYAGDATQNYAMTGFKSQAMRLMRVMTLLVALYTAIRYIEIKLDKRPMLLYNGGSDH